MKSPGFLAATILGLMISCYTFARSFRAPSHPPEGIFCFVNDPARAGFSWCHHHPSFDPHTNEMSAPVVQHLGEYHQYNFKDSVGKECKCQTPIGPFTGIVK